MKKNSYILLLGIVAIVGIFMAYRPTRPQAVIGEVPYLCDANNDGTIIKSELLNTLQAWIESQGSPPPTPTPSPTPTPTPPPSGCYSEVDVNCNGMLENSELEGNTNVPDWARGYTNMIVPPEGYGTGLVWVEYVHDVDYPDEQSTVELDYIKLFCRRGSSDTLIRETQYYGITAGEDWDGGLFERYCWYCGEWDSLNPSFSNGVMITHPNERIDRVWHTWSMPYPRASIPSDCDRVWGETRVRLTGKVYYQVGIDFYEPDGQEANEAGSSGWYSSLSDWRIIRVNEVSLPPNYWG